MSEYELLEFTETPSAFHLREIPEVPTPQIWWNRLTKPALVLGSAQRDVSIIDTDACAAEGIDVVRRRSGGGAVLLIPDQVVWFDVIVPAGSINGLGDDVHAPMLWLGEHLATALARSIQVGAQVSSEGRIEVKGPGMVTTQWSSLLCFDGVGPGEVLLGGSKLVGMSQRRTRTASRLQCCWYRSYNPARLPGLFRPDVRPDLSQLAPVATLDLPDAGALVGSIAAQLSKP